ncbi:MAG: hypothetical protein AAGA90_01390 [Actinomycetota bacterium]
MGQVDRARQVTTITTTRDANAALEHARRAVANVGSVGTTRVRVEAASNNTMHVALKPTIVGALHGAGRFTVQATPNESGSKVVIQFTDTVVTRPTLFGFIPVGPRSVMGIKAYERCVGAIRSAV